MVLMVTKLLGRPTMCRSLTLAVAPLALRSLGAIGGQQPPVLPDSKLTPGTVLPVKGHYVTAKLRSAGRHA
jgi:hypothetical protein